MITGLDRGLSDLGRRRAGKYSQEHQEEQSGAFHVNGLLCMPGGSGVSNFMASRRVGNTPARPMTPERLSYFITTG